MTTYWRASPSTGEGKSDAGQPESRPEPDEITLFLQRVLDGLKKQPTESSSDEGNEAA